MTAKHVAFILHDVMKKQRYLLALAVLGLIALAVAYFLNRDPGGSPGASIRVAANMPFSGDLAFYGGELRDGLLMAVADKGQQLPQGVSFAFDWGDNKFSAQDAVSVLQRQLQWSPTIYTSALKPQVMAVEQSVASRGIPHLAWVLDLSPNPAGTSNNFRTWISFKLESDVLFEYARKRRAKKVVLCFLSLPSTEQAYATYLADRLRSELQSSVVIERFSPNVNPSDFRNIAARLAANSPDLVLINGFIPHMVGIIKSMHPLGLIGDGNVIASLDMLDAANALTAEESEGIVVAAPPFMIAPNKEQEVWRKRFAAQYNRQPSYHAAFAYDAGLILVDAAGRLDHPASHEAWLRAILSTDIEGLTGRLRFDQDQSLVTTLAPAVYRGGKLLPLN